MTTEGTCAIEVVVNSGRQALEQRRDQKQHTVRSAKATTGKSGRTVSGKRSGGAGGSEFPSQRGRRTFPRRLYVCVEFHGGHEGRIAKVERPKRRASKLPPMFARGCMAVGSRLYPIVKKRVLALKVVHSAQ